MNMLRHMFTRMEQGGRMELHGINENCECHCQLRFL